jgi:hypothetical protein
MPKSAYHYEAPEFFWDEEPWEIIDESTLLTMHDISDHGTQTRIAASASEQLAGHRYRS